MKFKPVKRILLKQNKVFKKAGDFVFPNNYLRDFQYLAGLYGAKVTLQPFCKDGFAGGYNRKNRLCYIHVPDDKHDIIPTAYAVKVFCHELAHHIQYEEQQEEHPSSIRLTALEMLIEEQNTCDLGFELAKFYFSHKELYIEHEYYLEAFENVADIKHFCQYHEYPVKEINMVLNMFKNKTLPACLCRK